MWESLIYSQPIKSTGNNLNFQLASEAESSPVGLSLNLRRLMLSQVDSVKIQLNFRTPSWCPRIAYWCGTFPPTPLFNHHTGFGCRLLLFLEGSTLRLILFYFIFLQHSPQCWGRQGDFIPILLMKKRGLERSEIFPKVPECRFLTPKSRFFSQWYALIPPRFLSSMREETGLH